MGGGSRASRRRRGRAVALPRPVLGRRTAPGNRERRGGDGHAADATRGRRRAPLDANIAPPLPLGLLSSASTCARPSSSGCFAVFDHSRRRCRPPSAAAAPAALSSPSAASAAVATALGDEAEHLQRRLAARGLPSTLSSAPAARMRLRDHRRRARSPEQNGRRRRAGPRSALVLRANATRRRAGSRTCARRRGGLVDRGAAGQRRPRRCICGQPPGSSRASSRPQTSLPAKNSSLARKFSGFNESSLRMVLPPRLPVGVRSHRLRARLAGRRRRAR